MKINYFILVLVLFCVWSLKAFSQSDCETNPPVAPILTFVSVQPETGDTELRWTLSPSPDIAAYVIYTYRDPDGFPADTIWNPAATFYTFNNTSSKYYNVSYVVTAMRLPQCTSPFSNALTTIFTSASVDTCNSSILVSWNSYNPYPKAVTGYSLLSSVNGENFTELADISSGQTSYAINNFITDAEYCFIVRANLEGGLYSSSNMACLSTKMQRPPDWINADQTAVDPENGISLSFTVDPLSEITNFRLERKGGQTGDFEEIAQLHSTDGSVAFRDDLADINAVNYYRLSAINNCNIPVVYSNIASNIVLTLDSSGDELLLRWNKYESWSGNVSSYRLFIDTGQGFAERETIGSSDTSVTVRYSEIMYDVTGDKLCFFINAYETANPYGINGISKSSVACTFSVENITVPNVFTPNNDLINDLFRPVLSFTPVDYHLVISSRRGEVLFETRDFNSAWDGTVRGEPVPRGVCLWLLKLTTPSGRSISRTGTITLITNR